MDLQVTIFHVAEFFDEDCVLSLFQDSRGLEKCYCFRDVMMYVQRCGVILDPVRGDVDRRNSHPDNPHIVYTNRVHCKLVAVVIVVAIAGWKDSGGVYREHRHHKMLFRIVLLNVICA